MRPIPKDLKVPDTEAKSERERATDLLFRRAVVELFDGLLAKAKTV